MSRELEAGIKIGRGSLVLTQKALSDSLGRWAKILPYLDRLSSRAELELVASISYLLGRELELTPTLKASIVADFVESSKKILISDVEFLLGLKGGEHGEEKEE